VRSWVASVSLSATNTWTAAQRVAKVDVAYAASIALDLNTGNDFEIGLLTGNLTLAAPTNGCSGAEWHDLHAARCNWWPHFSTEYDIQGHIRDSGHCGQCAEHLALQGTLGD